VTPSSWRYGTSSRAPVNPNEGLAAAGRPHSWGLPNQGSPVLMRRELHRAVSPGARMQRARGEQHLSSEHGTERLGDDSAKANETEQTGAGAPATRVARPS